MLRVSAAVLFAVVTTLGAGVSSGQMGQPSFGPPGGAGAPRGKDAERPTYQPPVFEQRERGEPVVAVKIIGNKVLEESKVRTHLQTREGRDFDAEIVRADVRRLSSTGMFRNVQTYRKAVAGGVEVTFEVFELPLIGHLDFVGNEKMKDKTLRKEAELKVGEPLQRYRIEEARRKLHELYLKKGFTDAQVEVQEGLEAQDDGVVFSIFEC